MESDNNDISIALIDYFTPDNTIVLFEGELCISLDLDPNMQMILFFVTAEKISLNVFHTSKSSNSFVGCKR